MSPAVDDHPVTGEVVAVCADSAHNFTKPVRDAIRLVAGLGVEGDAHAGRTVQHLSRIERDPTQPNLRQVHLMQTEFHATLQQAGFDVRSGTLGENITTRGIDLLSLPKGTRLRVGSSAVLEVTGLRNPCRQIEAYSKGLLAHCLENRPSEGLVRKAGIMCVVLEDGVVKAGDRIVVELPPLPHVRLTVV